VVVLSALNPPPAHFVFMETRGIDGDELKTALYRGAVYQAVMRSSARNPNDTNPKRFIVMDRVTAEWLASGRWEVEIACRRHPCRVQLQPWYDPRNERIRS
jgi:hypothetical protein